MLPGRAPWRVRDLSHRELLRLDAGSWFSPAYAGESIPILAQAIDLLREGDTGLLLEVKHPGRYPGIEADVAETLRLFPKFVRSAAPSDRLVVQSFDHAAMRRFKDVEPEVPVGLLGRPRARRLPQLAGWASQVNPRHGSVDASYVAAVQAAGMACLAWTVDRPTDITRALGLGVDGVITNRPGVLADVVAVPLLPVA